jgi:hypothetical protein
MTPRMQTSLDEEEAFVVTLTSTPGHFAKRTRLPALTSNRLALSSRAPSPPILRFSLGFPRQALQDGNLHRLRPYGAVAAGTGELASLAAARKLTWRETIREGLENAPQALIDLLHGRNLGKMLVKSIEAERRPAACEPLTPKTAWWTRPRS